MTYDNEQPFVSKVYHVGNLAMDRYNAPPVSTKSKEESRKVDQKAKLYWELYKGGNGFLTQRRIYNGTFEYIWTPKKVKSVRERFELETGIP